MNPAAIFHLIFSTLACSPALSAAAHSSIFEVWPQTIASILASSLWQGAVVASGLALCLRLAPRISARMRYSIWAAGFAALVCLPFMPALIERLTAIISGPSHPSGMTAASVPMSMQSHPWVELDARWSLAIAALWLTASLGRAACLAVHAVRMRHLWSVAIPIGASGLDSKTQGAAARSAELCATNRLDRPCVIGFFRPRILIPNWLLTRLTADELDHVVLHELEHLRRMDDWTNLLQKLCLVVFPLNPALWWLERRLCAEREMACDDGVVSRTQAPRAYAACLAGLAERGLEHREGLRLSDALSLGAWQRRPELAQRVHRLLRRTPALSPVATAAAVALVSCGLVAGTIALARSPQLVAFVVPAQPVSSMPTATARNPQAGLEGDVNADLRQPSIAFAGLTTGPYRTVKTMAILPAARAASLQRNGHATSRANAQGRVDQGQQTGSSNFTNYSLASLVPSAIAARMNASQVFKPGTPQATQTKAVQVDSGQSNATQTSYLMLTTYEQIRTTGADEGVQGDAVAGETAANSAAPDARTSTSVTVTRLVFRLDQTAQPDAKQPPTSDAIPASNAPPNSNSSQPIAIPFRDGWFVIQL